MIRRGDPVVDVADPRGGWSIVVAGPDDRGHGGLLRGRQGIALCDETQYGSVLVDVSPDLVHGGGRGVWMRVLGHGEPWPH